MFRNLLPKEVFTGLFSLLHCLQFDEECLVYIFVFFAAGNCSSSLCEGQRMTMNITLGFSFSLHLYQVLLQYLQYLGSKAKKIKTRQQKLGIYKLPFLGTLGKGKLTHSYL